MTHNDRPEPRTTDAGPGPLGILVLLAAALLACDTGLLDVDDPTVLTPDEIAGANAVPTRLNGMIRGFQEAHDSYLRYAVYLTDEMIASGTITDRTDVDFRDVEANNVTLTNELYEELQTARVVSDQLISAFSESLGDSEFSEVQGELETGIALGNLYAGYVRVFFGELYCRAVVQGEGDGPALTSAETLQEALGFFDAAVDAADSYGFADVGAAARVGRARALIGLGRYADAASAVASIPTEFVYTTEYSSNTFAQSNELMQWTWGQGGPNIRWTIGDGTAAERDRERFLYFDEWAAQGLIDSVAPGLSADNAALPVNLQLLYAELSSNIVLASGWEARMVEAEEELRLGDPEVAEDSVNALLTDPAQTYNPMLAVNPGLASSRMGGRIPAMGAFDPVDFTGSLATDLEQMARARAAGLWLTGERQATLRRFSEGDGVDLFPERRGDDVCLPIVQQEIDNNPNVGG